MLNLQISMRQAIQLYQHLLWIMTDYSSFRSTNSLASNLSIQQFPQNISNKKPSPIFRILLRNKEFFFTKWSQLEMASFERLKIIDFILQQAVRKLGTPITLIYLNYMDEGKSLDNKDNANSQSESGIIEQKITLANGELKIKKYSKGKALGRGGFAKCYEVTNLETKKVLAAKIIAKSSLSRSRAKQKLISEIKIHKSLNNNHVVKFEHVFEDAENVYILLEICTNHTLNELIKRRKRLTEMQAQYYLSQIVSALKYLHQNKVIHRDLKLGNLFLNENMEIKLGDFGLATRLQYEGQKKKTICGTPNYIAPEILQNKGHSYEVDVWSVGVIIYTQLIGKPPFETPEVKSTYKKIKACQYTFPDHITISQNAKNLIQKILVLDPSKRPTLDEIMSDPFMTSEPIPKTMPRSTLACPPPSNFREQIKGNTVGNQSQPRLSQFRESEAQKKISRNDSEERGFNAKNAVQQLTTKEAFGNSGTNFRASSKEGKGQQSSKNLASNVNSYGTLTKKPNKQETAEKNTNMTHPQVHVKKWVDYSTKYGLGYLLSDGSTGVYFNDSTKIILDKNNQVFEYIEKKQGEKVDTISRYTLSEYPQERQLQKKVTLLQHFRNYLYADTNKIELSDNKESGFCYVKKWMKTKHAIMFRLSNKIVQVNFTDRTEIILSSEQKLVTYINLKGERSQYPLATALDSRNAEMAKRLKYTKQILTHMLNGTNVPPSSAGPGEDIPPNNMASSSKGWNKG